MTPEPPHSQRERDNLLRNRVDRLRAEVRILLAANRALRKQYAEPKPHPMQNPFSLHPGLKPTENENG